MIEAFRIQEGYLVQSEIRDANILVYSQLNTNEKSQLISEFSLDPLDLEAINDPDEVPRIELLEDGWANNL